MNKRRKQITIAMVAFSMLFLVIEYDAKEKE